MSSIMEGRYVPDIETDAPCARNHLDRYKWVISWKYDSDRVLDLGCGVGYGSHLLANAAYQVIGLDMNIEAVAYAAHTYKHPNISYVAGNAVQLPFPDAVFGLITCFEVMEHLYRPEALLHEIRRVLKPEGVAIISVPNTEGLRLGTSSINPHHVQDFTADTFGRILEKVFLDAEIWAQHFSSEAERRYTLVHATIARVKRKLGLTRRWLPPGLHDKLSSWLFGFRSQRPEADHDLLNFTQYNIAQAADLIAVCRCGK